MAVEWIGRVLIQLRTFRQAEQLLCQREELVSLRLVSRLGEEEEVGEIHDAIGVEIKAEVAAAEGLGEQEKVSEWIVDKRGDRGSSLTH